MALLSPLPHHIHIKLVVRRYPTCSLFPSFRTDIQSSQHRPLRTPHDISRALPIPQRTCTIESIHLLIFTKGGTYTVQRILTFITRLYDTLTSSAHERPQIVVKQALITEKSRPPSFGAGLAWNGSVETHVLAAACGSQTPQTRVACQRSL
jgi:hypothetical protein